MTPNKRDLKSYARFDGTGRIIPGSLVLRRNKPKVGNWKEVPAYECCNPDQQSITVTVYSSYPIVQPDLFLQAHIHEAEGIEEKIGKTRVINVGRRGTVIDI